MSALEDLREALRDAARRDIGAGRVRTRRRRRRATGLIVLALLGGAAAAGAADLISVGEPISAPPGQAAAYRAAGGEPVQIAVKADSGGELPFAVGTYRARNGKACALAGQLRRTEPREAHVGKFRPFDAGRSSACGTPGRSFFDQVRFREFVVVFGRAGVRVRRVQVLGTDRSGPVGRGGAFLFVFTGVPERRLLPVVFVE